MQEMQHRLKNYCYIHNRDAIASNEDVLDQRNINIILGTLRFVSF